MTHVTCRLTAKNRDQLRNRVSANLLFFSQQTWCPKQVNDFWNCSKSWAPYFRNEGWQSTFLRVIDDAISITVGGTVVASALARSTFAGRFQNLHKQTIQRLRTIFFLVWWRWQYTDTDLEHVVQSTRLRHKPLVGIHSSSTRSPSLHTLALTHIIFSTKYRSFLPVCFPSSLESTPCFSPSTTH